MSVKEAEAGDHHAYRSLDIRRIFGASDPLQKASEERGERNCAEFLITSSENKRRAAGTPTSENAISQGSLSLHTRIPIEVEYLTSAALLSLALSNPRPTAVLLSLRTDLDEEFNTSSSKPCRFSRPYTLHVNQLFWATTNALYDLVNCRRKNVSCVLHFSTAPYNRAWSPRWA